MKSVSSAGLAEKAAPFLAALGNAKRLTIMYHLNDNELPVGVIAERVGLSQSALSQHLARLRELGMVETRRDRQMIYYSCARGLPQELLNAVNEIFRRAASAS